MKRALLWGGIAGLSYIAYRVYIQASTPGAGGTGAAFRNWAVSPLGIGSAAAVAYAVLS